MEDNKLVAAVAAVAAYMEEEASAHLPIAPPLRLMPGANLWGAFGREEIMRMRTLWQRRIVSR